MNSTTQTREVFNLGIARSYPEARKMAERRGMELAPYLLVDRHAAKKGGSFVSKELFAHPVENGVFQNGRDINDSITDLSIAAEEVPRRAFGRKGIGMVLVPRDGAEGLEPRSGRIYVHPQSIVVFDGMIQTSDEWVPGKPHDALGIPVAISPEEFACLTEEQKRWLLRIAGEGVRPLVRGYGGWGGGGGGGPNVYANFGEDDVPGMMEVLAIAGGAEKTATPG